MLRDHRAELDTLLTEYARLQQRYTRLKSQVLPLAEHKVDLAETAYAANTGELATLLGARRGLLERHERLIDADAAMQRLAVTLYYTYEGGEHDSD